MVPKSIDLTDEQREAMREHATEEYDGMVSVSSSKGISKTLHLPGENGKPLCDMTHHGSSWNHKPIDAYPLGYFPWCRRCVRRSSITEE